MQRLIVTSTRRDGSLRGPDLGLLSEVMAEGLPVLAAGGIAVLLVYLEAVFRRSRLATPAAYDAWSFWLPKAESLVYFHGLDTGAYTVPYVAGWAGGAKGAVLAAAERVLSTASSILDAAAPDEAAVPETTTTLVATRGRGAVVDLTGPVTADTLMTVQR